MEEDDQISPFLKIKPVTQTPGYLDLARLALLGKYGNNTDCQNSLIKQSGLSSPSWEGEGVS